MKPSQHTICRIEGHEVKLDPANTLITVRFSGRVTYPDLNAFAQNLYAHPKYNQDWDIIFHMGQAKFDLSFTDLLNYANAISKDSRHVLGATVLVSPSPISYGIGRMYASTAGNALGTLQIEKTEEAALAWLKQHREKRQC